MREIVGIGFYIARLAESLGLQPAVTGCLA